MGGGVISTLPIHVQVKLSDLIISSKTGFPLIPDDSPPLPVNRVIYHSHSFFRIFVKQQGLILKDHRFNADSVECSFQRDTQLLYYIYYVCRVESGVP